LSAIEKLPGASGYMDAVRARLDAIAENQGAAIDRAATALMNSIAAEGVVYIFGTGHSHMMAEEGHYRAGGLACVVPILSTVLMLHEGAVLSTQVERTSGIAETLLERYQPEARDSLIIFSNSGVNSVPVEMALAAKNKGLTVIAIVAMEYAAAVKPGASGKKLNDVADIVVDNHGVPGDALVEIGDTGLKTGPLSTIAGAFILNAILTETTWRLAANGHTPPVFISANMPGSAVHNAGLIAKYRSRNPHL
jgi:uncharacterized phosphosugar-binding protein